MNDSETMGDDESMGDVFRDMRAAHRNRRDERLATADPTGWTVHTEHHWSRKLNGTHMDYWPGAGKWQFGGKTHRGNDKDVRGFIARRERRT